VDAPGDVVFRWLCQLRVAPYSYDWIDNFGRRSPQALTPGLDQLAVGQLMMGRWRFRLVEFERGRQITMKHSARLGGDTAVTMLIAPANGGSRLLVKAVQRCPGGLAGWLERLLLPWVDLVMMRRQLLNLKALAERTARAGAGRAGAPTSPGGGA
jgi:hypothetical protein